MGVQSIGMPVRREEDFRLLRGKGRYVDDVRLPREARGYVVRSPHAHARIVALDAVAARAAPGVLAVLTAEDVHADGLQALRPSAEANATTGERFAFAPQPLLAEDKVRYVGEPVALIVAENRDQALDAAERIAVDYVPLSAVTMATAALVAGAPLLSPQVPRNLCFEWHAGDSAAVDRAFAAAAHVVSIDVASHRIVTNPMEPRGVIGLFNPASGRYTAHVSAQSIHATRDHAARAE